MAITTVPSFAVPAMWQMGTGGSSVSAVTLNASGDRIGFVVQCPKAGTLDKFECMVGTVGNNPDNGIRLSFQTVSLSTGDPDGTQSQYRDITGTLAANTWQVPGLMPSDGTDGGVKRTVAAGELLGCVVDFVSFVASDSFAVQVFGVSGMYRNWYVDNASTGSYVKSSTSAPILALKYDDGTYAIFDIPIWPIVDSNQVTSFNSSTSPDERGLRFQVGTSMRAVGYWFVVDGDNAFDVVLYDSGGSVLDTQSYDPDQRNAANTMYYVGYFPSGPHTLTASTTYRLILKPTTTSSITYWELELPSAAYQACIPGGVEWYATSRTDAGAWTDDQTRRPQMGLIFDGIDVSTGGGGGSYVSFG